MRSGFYGGRTCPNNCRGEQRSPVFRIVGDRRNFCFAEIRRPDPLARLHRLCSFFYKLSPQRAAAILRHGKVSTESVGANSVRPMASRACIGKSPNCRGRRPRRPVSGSGEVFDYHKSFVGERNGRTLFAPTVICADNASVNRQKWAVEGARLDPALYLSLRSGFPVPPAFVNTPLIK